MNIGNFLLLTLIIWVLGFLRTWIAPSNERFLLSIPDWLFYLLGYPKNKYFGKGIVTRGGYWFQLNAYAMLMQCY